MEQFFSLMLAIGNNALLMKMLSISPGARMSQSE
jgi:hypothetical protein